jgi:Subtilase family
MTDVRPLLPFGPPRSGPIPPGVPRPIPRPRVPAARQGERLSPQFRALGEAFAAGRMAAGSVPVESDPELVVVFDLAGTVQEFRRAVSGVAGLEFLAELADEDVEPDDDFHLVRNGTRTTASLDHTLYTMMSSARAATELIRLFDLWTADRATQFPSGMAPLRTAFEQLLSLRRWGPEDRIRETGLLEYWRETLDVKGAQGTERVEIELWFRSQAQQRSAAEAHVSGLVRAAGGTVVHRAVIVEIEYHALLVDLPADQVESVRTAGPGTISLLRAETVMLMSPAEPVAVTLGEPSEVPLPPSSVLPTELLPRVALLDGMPVANHEALAGRLLVDDPDDLEPRYPVAARRHGTAMASLICHGDLSAPGEPLASRLYVRPVMEPDVFHPAEKIVRDELLVDLLHRCFRRMFERVGSADAAAPSVRIVNLSLGDPARTFVRRIGPLARMVDWLAHTYNVVVLVSAGNHPEPPPISAAALADPASARPAMVEALRAAALHRRLLAPAEAINALTVGAAHTDAAQPPASDTVVDVMGDGMPACYSAIGSGHGRSVKPEILLPGGRQTFQRPVPGATGGVSLLPAQQAAIGPGLLTASPGLPRGAATAFGYGTSHATALATRACDRVFTALTDLGEGIDGRPFPDAQYHPVIARALMIHAADWAGLDHSLREAVGNLSRKTITQVLGYGRIVEERLADATRTRVCLLGAGTISHGIRQSFDLPLPDALLATKEWRRLTVTLAWFSPVNPRSRGYRIAKLSAQVPHARFGVDSKQADQHSSRRGTVQHQVYEGTKALGFASGDRVAVDVDCTFDRAIDAPPVRYGLAVSVEMAATIQVDVHAQVRESLRIRDRARTPVRSHG